MLNKQDIMRTSLLGETRWFCVQHQADENRWVLDWIRVIPESGSGEMAEVYFVGGNHTAAPLKQKPR